MYRYEVVSRMERERLAEASGSSHEPVTTGFRPDEQTLSVSPGAQQPVITKSGDGKWGKAS